jgi:hypothetical protein
MNTAPPIRAVMPASQGLGAGRAALPPGWGGDLAAAEDDAEGDERDGGDAGADELRSRGDEAVRLDGVE